MPTYTYACTQCGHAFDIRQSFTDDPLTDCPECADGAGRLRKVIHPVGIAFKGSGFYKTDSRAAAKSSGPSGKGSDSGSSASETAASSGSSTATTSPEGSGSTAGSEKSSSGKAGSGAASSGSGSTGGTGPSKPGGAAAS